MSRNRARCGIYPKRLRNKLDPSNEEKIRKGFVMSTAFWDATSRMYIILDSLGFCLASPYGGVQFCSFWIALLYDTHCH